MMKPTILMAGGGTGGHLFPMLAVCDELRTLSDVEVIFVGTARGIESRVLRARDEKLELLDVAPLMGQGIVSTVRGTSKALVALPAAHRLVKRHAPALVLSAGGYAAGPVSLAARVAGVPVALLEPNSVLGLANRLIAPFVRRAYLAFPEVARNFRRGIALHTGVPLRRGFERSEYLQQDGSLKILVSGGSQGARGLNEIVPDAIARASRSIAGLSVVHQSGVSAEHAVRARYAALDMGGIVRVAPFLDDMATQIASADIVIQRAGAGAVAELCAIGRASILVPFPYAAGDHQRKNAEALAKVGAAIAIDQAQLTPERLASAILALASSASRRANMAELASRQGRTGAARIIAEDLVKLVSLPPIARTRASLAPLVTLAGLMLPAMHLSEVSHV